MKNNRFILKKKSIINFFIFLFLVILFYSNQSIFWKVYAAEENKSLNEVEEYTSDIFFDTESVKKRVKSYSALSDLYGVSVFQDSFIELEKQYKEAQEQKYEEIETAIFTSAPWKGDYEKWVNGVLESGEVKVIKEAYQPTAAKSDILTWLAGIFFSASLLCIAFVIDDIRKKKKKANGRSGRENNIDSYHI